MPKRPFKIANTVFEICNRSIQISCDYSWFLRFALLKPLQDWLSASIERRKRSPLARAQIHASKYSAAQLLETSKDNPIFSQKSYNTDSENAPLLVFLPGIYEGKLYFHYLTELLWDYEILQIEHLGKMKLPVAVHAKNVIRDLSQIRRPIILIAHSKGGLVGRAVLAAKLPHIYGLITFATPWNGSSCAKLFPPWHPLHMLIPGGSDTFIPWSESLEREISAKIVSLAPHWDLHVPEGSFLLGAKNIELRLSGHFRPLYHNDGIIALRNAIVYFSKQIRNADASDF